MSPLKNLRKRTSFSYNNSSDTMREKPNPEIGLHESEAEDVRHKQLTVSSNGKVFFPCQYCKQIFSQKLACTNHMTICPKKIETRSVLNEHQSKLNNNDMDVTEPCTNEDSSNCSSSDENKPSEENKISETRNKNDVSIYDYDEEDDDDLEDNGGDLRGNGEDSNNRHCKHCKTLFDNPLDLLRHTRDCHNFPRTILSPDEIEKYFDYPNRQFCPICEKPIKTRNFRSVFIKHLLVHTTGLTHECSVCKKKFRRRDHMRAHEKRHVVSG